MRSALALVVLAVLLGPAVVTAQDVAPSDFVVGVQTADGEPVAGATVLLGANRGASTDADGRAVFEDVAPGRYPVRVSFVGMVPREIAAVLEAPGPWGHIVELADATNLLYDVVVEARSLEGTRLEQDGFFRRLDLGAGSFLTPEDIAKRNPLFLTDVLRGSLPGIRVRPAAGRMVATSFSAARECRLSVFLDGLYSPALSYDLSGFPAQGVAISPPCHMVGPEEAGPTRLASRA